MCTEATTVVDPVATGQRGIEKVLLVASGPSGVAALSMEHCVSTHDLLLTCWAVQAGWHFSVISESAPVVSRPLFPISPVLAGH